MASLYKLRELPVIGDCFLLFDNLLKVVRDASIKHKFSFKVLHKDKKRARYKCNNKDCPWSVIAYLNLENDKEVMLIMRYSLRITILHVDSESTFLLHARGLTIRGNSDDKVQVVTIGSADEVRGYHFLSVLYKSYGWY
jgi:hypothetical protein